MPDAKRPVTVKELTEYLQSIPAELQDCKVFIVVDSLDFFISGATIDYPYQSTEVAVRLFRG